VVLLSLGVMNVEDRFSPEKTEHLLSNTPSRQDARQAVRQLLAGSRLRPSVHGGRRRSRSGPGNEEASPYDDAFQKTHRVLARVHDQVRRERRLAGAQWESLKGHPPARQLVMVRNDSRLHHWGLYELLLAISRETAQRDATGAADFAVLALTIAERLDPQAYGGERIADFKTAALTLLGDARRRAGDLAGARLAFSQARIHLEMGTGDLLEEADLLSGLVNLLCDLGEYEKAARSLERAGALYRLLGDDRLEGVRVPTRKEETAKNKPQQGSGIG
jgi:tetratricopeptide (TPR) repeat protein